MAVCVWGKDGIVWEICEEMSGALWGMCDQCRAPVPATTPCPHPRTWSLAVHHSMSIQIFSRKTVSAPDNGDGAVSDAGKPGGRKYVLRAPITALVLGINIHVP